jgi:hypothetical protein
MPVKYCRRFEFKLGLQAFNSIGGKKTLAVGEKQKE